MTDIKTELRQVCAFTARNIKVFFKDKGSFIAAFIAPLVLMVLYALFLHKVFLQSFDAMLEGAAALDAKTVNGLVASYEVSSVLSVCCTTVAFVANMNMVSDKVSGARNDITVTPAKGRVIVLGYYFATAIVTICICLITTAVGFCYIAGMGWSMSVGETFAVILDVILASLFGTALSSVVCYFLKSNGAINAVSTIVSSIYGFICGAYYPISQFSSGMANTIMCLPGTYCTGIFRTHFLSGYGTSMIEQGIPETAVNGLLDGFDARFYFFDNLVPQWVMYVVVICSIAALVAAFVAINKLCKNRDKN